MASKLSFHFCNTDYPYVRCYDENRGERHLGDIATRIRDINEADWSFALDDFVTFAPPYDRYFVFDNWGYWVRDIIFELSMFSSGRLVSLGWHNLEVFVLLLQHRDEFQFSRL